MQPNLTGTTVRLQWAREQLLIARDILDNPGGGLVFGYQAMGQVGAHLAEAGGERYAALVQLLQQAEGLAVRREFGPAQDALRRALEILPES